MTTSICFSESHFLGPLKNQPMEPVVTSPQFALIPSCLPVLPLPQLA